jgi:hypothetical protein
VQTAVAVFRVLEAREDRLVLVELLLLDTDVDLDNILPDDAAGADVEVADLGVAHEPVGESYREAVRGDGPVRVVARDRVHVRRVACGDRVALHVRLRRDAPAIVYAGVD